MDLRSLWSKYFSEAHLLFFVIDGNDLDRSREVEEVIEGLIGDEDCKGLPMAVLINKCDLFGDSCVDMVIKVKETFNPLFSTIQARESKVFSVSALKGYQ